MLAATTDCKAISTARQTTARSLDHTPGQAPTWSPCRTYRTVSWAQVWWWGSCEGTRPWTTCNSGPETSNTHTRHSQSNPDTPSNALLDHTAVRQRHYEELYRNRRKLSTMQRAQCIPLYRFDKQITDTVRHTITDTVRGSIRDTVRQSDTQWDIQSET